MAIAPLTFNYRFPVRSSGILLRKWTGEGISKADSDETGGLGPNPRFEMSGGWVTLFPTEGWTQSIPTHWFSDVPPASEDARKAQTSARTEAFIEARKESGGGVPRDRASLTAQHEAMQRALRRRGLVRDLVSYSVFVGEALGTALRDGDEFKFSCDRNGHFHYSAARNLETTLSAGFVPRADRGGPMAVWQEYERQPSPNPPEHDMSHLFRRASIEEEGTSSGLSDSRLEHARSPKWVDVERPYVTARVKEEVFHLRAGQEVHIDPYYVFLARSNHPSPWAGVRAIHSAGRLDSVGKEQIIDAAQQLTAPKAKLL